MSSRFRLLENIAGRDISFNILGHFRLIVGGGYMIVGFGMAYMS